MNRQLTAEELMHIWKENYPMMNSRYLAWCWLNNRNPYVPFGGNENNIEYINWINDILMHRHDDSDNIHYWEAALKQKGQPHEEVHRSSVGNG